MTPYQAAKLSFTITITILLVISQADQSFNAENQCHSSCSNGRFSRPLPFPFGFSSGCHIKLNCTSTGVTVGNFPVLNITSTDIIIDLPANCSRKLASLSVLFGKNYALSSANSLLLHNCSKPSPGPCEMRPMFLGRSSTLKSCYAKSDNVSCFAATDGGQLLSFEEINNTQCRFLFTSTSIVTKNSAVSLEMERVRLEWWLDGDCNCDTNAKCTNVTKGKEGNNTLVGYRCHCNEGFEGDGFKAGLGCRKASRHGSSARIVILVGGAGLGFGILLVVICRAYRYYENRRRKMKLFESNGGLLLRQQLSSCEGNIGKTRIFTLKDMETATDNFSGSRILGKGGQGTVFQGKFADGRIVAVKRSKLVDRENIKEFINEIVILSQINHRHVVKLLGCCLETEVPLLVYEFVSNGALFQYLHGPHSKLSLTWGMRVRIASEAAGAISYLHSVASFPIYHRDIKSTNILLDEKFRAKVSDFGTSRSISIDQTHVTTLVHGTFGYLDPEYFETSQFTDKSDVYSFGVVLVELLTGKSPGSLARTGEDRSLATYFVASMEEDQLFEILDARILDECCTSEIIVVAGLAKKCLRLNGKDRPTMKEVAMELERVQQMQKKMNAKPNSEEPEPELKYVEEPDLLDIFEYVEEPELALPR